MTTWWRPWTLMVGYITRNRRGALYSIDKGTCHDPNAAILLLAEYKVLITVVQAGGGMLLTAQRSHVPENGRLGGRCHPQQQVRFLNCALPVPAPVMSWMLLIGPRRMLVMCPSASGSARRSTPEQSVLSTHRTRPIKRCCHVQRSVCPVYKREIPPAAADYFYSRHVCD